MNEEEFPEAVKKHLDFSIAWHAQSLAKALMKNQAYSIETEQSNICVYSFLKKLADEYFKTKKENNI